MTDPSKLALKGSSKVVCDYFEFAINNILFQRGIYPAEDFQTVKKYDLPLLICIDEDIKLYINRFLSQIKRWVYGSKMKKLVLIIVDKPTGEAIERWEFSIEILQSDRDNNNNENIDEKSKDEIKREIQAIIRQVTSSVAYLPILSDSEYTFNILVHADQNTVNVPNEWADVNDKNLDGNIESVDFSSFQTDLHKVGTKVSYKYE